MFRVWVKVFFFFLFLQRKKCMYRRKGRGEGLQVLSFLCCLNFWFYKETMSSEKKLIKLLNFENKILFTFSNPLLGRTSTWKNILMPYSLQIPKQNIIWQERRQLNKIYLELMLSCFCLGPFRKHGKYGEERHSRDGHMLLQAGSFWQVMLGGDVAPRTGCAEVGEWILKERWQLAQEGWWG